MKLIKIFLLSFVSGLFFWYGTNALGEDLEDFFFAQISYPVQEIFFSIPPKDKKPRIPVSVLDIKAKSVFSVKIDKRGRQEIFYEKNSDKVLPIASLSKLMTALIVFRYPEYYDFSKPITISKQAVAQEESFGALKYGEKISIDDLLHITLIESSNDAAYALSEIISRGTDIEPKKRAEPFIGLMNLEIEKKLGLKNTKLVNPTGLDPENLELPKNISCAKDLIKMSSFILQKYPKIFEISSKLSYEVLDNSGNPHHLVINTNKLLDPYSEICANDEDWQKIIPNIIGGKTGYTQEAGGCMILLLKDKKGNHFINVILGANNQESRFEEMKKLVKRVSEI